MVLAHSAQTSGVLGLVLEGSRGVPWGSPRLWGILAGVPGFHGGVLGNAWDLGFLEVPGSSLGLPGGP